MKKTQPFFNLQKKLKQLEVWSNGVTRPYQRYFTLNDEEIDIAEKLLTRDFKMAILYRRHPNEGLAIMANDIIENRG